MANLLESLEKRSQYPESINTSPIRLKTDDEKMIEKLDSLRAFKQFSLKQFVITTQNSEAFHAIETFDKNKDNLYLWGNCGTGKTHLIYALARQYNSQEFMLLKPTRLMRIFRGLEPKAESEALEDFKDFDLLIIDDLGVGRATEFAIQILYEIIDKRDMAMKNGLIITSNLSLDDISTKLEDDRLTSRIAGMCKVIKIEGEDMRLEKKEES